MPNSKNHAGGGSGGFAVKDCTLVAIATGRRARDLRELRDHLRDVEADSLYYHFWGGLLRAKFADPEFGNDFAGWARHALHDHVLAERLGILDPTHFDSLEGLREELIDRIEDRLDDLRGPELAEDDADFHFIRGQLVVFDTELQLGSPEDLLAAVPRLSVGSLYYHLIDARRRTPTRINDFAAWVGELGPRYADFHQSLLGVEVFVASLQELRHNLLAATRPHLAKPTGGGA